MDDHWIRVQHMLYLIWKEHNLTLEEVPSVTSGYFWEPDFVDFVLDYGTPEMQEGIEV